MKLKRLSETGHIVRKKPSTKKIKIPLSAYGDEPITTFHSKDQDSAMDFWKDILNKVNKVRKNV